MAGMQNKSFTIGAGGTVPITAPCACEAFDIVCTTHAFSFTYGDDARAGVMIGAAAPADVLATSFWRTTVYCSKGQPFLPGETIGMVTGTAADTVYVRPHKTW